MAEWRKLRAHVWRHYSGAELRAVEWEPGLFFWSWPRAGVTRELTIRSRTLAGAQSEALRRAITHARRLAASLGYTLER